MFIDDAPSFLQLLDEQLDLDSFTPGTVLSDFFALHLHFQTDIFLEDSTFDTIDIYEFLKNEFHFSKALIPYNTRNESRRDKVG